MIDLVATFEVVALALVRNFNNASDFACIQIQSIPLIQFFQTDDITVSLGVWFSLFCGTEIKECC